MPFFNTIINKILDIVFPVICVGCRKTGTNFCIKCISSSPFALRECDEWIFPLFDYRHPPIKKALWLLKYKNKRGVAEEFAKILYGKMMEELSDITIMESFRDSILIPIPLSKGRYRERGYNQVELICEQLVKLDNNVNFILENNVLVKPKDTEHQARIKNRKERLKNIIGSFSTKNENLVKNKNIILIDDILTTGATLTEAKKALKKAGAKKIIAFTIAH
jgi:competence protein ComFC